MRLSWSIYIQTLGKSLEAMYANFIIAETLKPRILVPAYIDKNVHKKAALPRLKIG